MSSGCTYEPESDVTGLVSTVSPDEFVTRLLVNGLVVDRLESRRIDLQNFGLCGDLAYVNSKPILYIAQHGIIVKIISN